MTDIEKRIVEMGFDNKQFETGVGTTLKSLDSLKKGLNFDNAGKGMAGLSAMAKGIQLGNIADGVNNLSNRFSAMGIVGMTIIQNITTAVMNLAVSLGKAVIGVDAMSQGFSSYETKINAVKTVMSATGEDIETVKKSINELNNYSDRTVYSFQDMTSNISKFTNAGLKSKEAALAIQGISNVAAISGANANEAARAMYNFGQALSQGSVRLLDWKSIENANMATVEFKTQLLETGVAMGTLTKVEDGYKTKKGELISATRGFNDSLQEQWLSTEVLISTLGDYASTETEIGKKANQAATELKTWTQLMDNIQDSLKTGWTKSWEYLFGDLNEATELFTFLGDTINGFLGDSANARNAILKDWHDLGGRAFAFTALKEGIGAVMSIIGQFKDAFAEIFPPLTGQKLVLLTAKFALFIHSLVPGAEALEKFKSVFKGIASALDIVIRFATAAIIPFKILFLNLVPDNVGSKFLDMAANLGEFVTKLRDGIVANETFKKAFEKIGWEVLSVFENISEFVNMLQNEFSLKEVLMGDTKYFQGITKFTKPVVEFFDKVSLSLLTFKEAWQSAWEKVDLNGVGSALDKFTGRVSPLTKIFNFVGKALSTLGVVAKKAFPILSKIGAAVFEGLSQLGNTIADALRNLDFNKIFDVLNAGLLAGLILALKKFVLGGEGAMGEIGGVFGNISGLLEGVRGTLEGYQKSLQAKTLMSIALAVAVLAGALVVLSLIDSGKLTGAIAAVTLMFAELAGTMTLMQNASGGGVAKFAAELIGLSAAVLIMSFALAKVAKLKPEEINNGIAAVAGLGAVLVGFSASLSKFGGGAMKGTLQFVILAVALEMMVNVLQKLAAMDMESLKQGLIGIGALLAEIGIFTKLTNDAAGGIGKGLGLILIAAALNIMATAVGKFASLDPQAMGQGLTAIAGVLAEIAIFLKVTKDAKNVIPTAIGLTILAAAMLIFSKAIAEMGGMSWEELGKGLAGMAGALGIVALAMNAMPKNMLKSAVGMVLVAGALTILAKALQDMGGMSWEAIAKGLVALGGSMLILALAMHAMSSGLAGAAAMLVMSAALAIFVPILKTLGSMSLQEIGLALLALAGSFAVIGLAGLLIGPLTPILAALAAVMLIFSVALLTVATATLIFSTALAALAVSGAAGASAIALIVTTLIALIPMMVTKIVEGIVSFATQIAAAAPVLVAAMIATLMAIVTGIVGAIPSFVESMLTLVTTILDTLNSKLPEILEKGTELLKNLLEGVANAIPEVVPVVVDIVTEFISSIGAKLPEIIQTGVDFAINFINGVADGIRNNQQAIIDAIGNLADSLIGGLTAGISKGAEAVVNALGGVVNGAIEGAKRLLGIASPSKVFDWIGQMSDKGLIRGFVSKAGEVAKAAGDVGTAAADSLISAVSHIANSVNDSLDLQPVISPVLDLSAVSNGAKDINGMLSSSIIAPTGVNSNLSSISSGMRGDATQQLGSQTSMNISLTQNNYSPESLSPFDIYRQTRNQLKLLKGLVPSI